MQLFKRNLCIRNDHTAYLKNKEMKYIMEIVKYLEESSLLSRDEKTENEAKNKKASFLVCC